MKIDININMHHDSNNGDPDTRSKLLNQYHFLLWNKKLPNGNFFNLKKVGRKVFYLELDVYNNKWLLSSDSIVHTYSYRNSLQSIVSHIDQDYLERFRHLSGTIGGFILFPAKRIQNKATVNAVRGMHPLIQDRFDLTLECIKRYYNGIDSPLYEHLFRYKKYFDLFDNFKGFVDFFLLNDLVDNDYNIKFWLPFINFDKSSPIPKDTDAYKLFMHNSIDFMNLRNQRIRNYSENIEEQINIDDGKL